VVQSLPLESEVSSENLLKSRGTKSMANTTDTPATADTMTEADFEEIKKLAQIAQIVELMDDTHKGKDWLTDQIKQKRQKVPIKAGLGTVGILKMCSNEFVSNVLGSLKSDEIHEIDDIVTVPPITVTYHWFFTDIVAGSDPTITTNEQARKIVLLNKLVEVTDIFKQRDPDSTLVLPTGDGMAIGFSDSPEKPLNLSIEVHKGLNRYNKPRPEKDKVHLRIGLDTGPVYIIKDLNGHENVWGPGIIMARRVMDLAEKMNILCSARFANDIKMLRPEYKSILHPIGDYQIKHGDKLLIYNIYGGEFGNKKSPSMDKKQKSKAEEEVQKTSSRFLFSQVTVELDVKDIKTMLTHHTMVWNLVNVSSEPIDKIFYYLDGDTARDFPELNVTVKDEDDKELDIMSLNVNKPYHKEFFVKVRRPFKPGEKGRMVTIEYDWEEPDRHFFYRFASDCKKFDYRLTIPKGIPLNQKVVKVDTETGDKTYASTPAAVKQFADKVEITWSIQNIRAFEAYRFDW